MKLTEYLKKRKITQVELAIAAGCSKAHISQICRLGRRPSPDVAARIASATNGEVSVLDLLYPDTGTITVGQPKAGAAPIATAASFCATKPKCGSI